MHAHRPYSCLKNFSSQPPFFTTIAAVLIVVKATVATTFAVAVTTFAVTATAALAEFAAGAKSANASGFWAQCSGKPGEKTRQEGMRRFYRIRHIDLS